MRRVLVSLGVLALASGCLRPLADTPHVDSGVNLAAYVAHDRIVVQQLPGGGNGAVQAQSGFHFGASSYDLIESGKAVAELRRTETATVAVSAHGTNAGSIQPAWDDNAIRLDVRGADGTQLHTDTFARTVSGTGPAMLTRNAQSNIDVRGTYRAAVRDVAGTEVGWLRIRVSPYQESPRIYDGVLPAAVSPAVAAAIPLALDSEIDWIEAHTLDLYRGSGSGDGIRQGVPLGR